MARSKFYNTSFLVLVVGLALTGASCLNFEARASSLPVPSPAQQDKAAALVAEGLAALERNDLAAAQASFERALEIDRHSVAAHTYLGVLADRAGRLEEAERHFAAAAIDAPLSPEARNNHGAILLRLGRTQQAAAQFEISLRLNKNQPSALVNLAQIRFASDTPEGFEQARELFERAWAIAPDTEIARSLIITALRLNNMAAASLYFRRYAEQIKSSAGTTIEPSARAELGGALLSAGLVAEAIEELSAVASTDPNNVSVLLLLARAHLMRKDIPAAGRTLESAVARGLQEAPIYAALADIYERSGHVENAIPAMRLAIERDPKNEFYRFRYGMLLTDTKAPRAAVIRLQEALQSFPRSSKLWFALGVAHFSNHNNDEAAKAFQQALEIDPNFAPALSYMGLMQTEQGQYKAALTLYEKALAIDEKLAIVHFLAADALIKEASAVDLARAEKHLVRAIALDQSFAPAQLALGKLYQRLERLEDAAKQFEYVTKLQPNLAEAHYQLGRLYTRLKRTNEAQAELATFKRLSDEQKEQSQSNLQEIVRRLANVRF